ncbi:K66 protein [Saccharomyces paradoxus L-A virus M66 satellite]|uniref:K66 protein n=1 Tax=Saccharomyces paradoxus L-A virus M66 satellite TaxID=2484116 RepID=A0A3G2M388_9VIRU|nr:K66 protein [Saccharomyces paradoxus L-A virus M66 satellite]
MSKLYNTSREVTWRSIFSLAFKIMLVMFCVLAVLTLLVSRLLGTSQSVDVEHLSMLHKRARWTWVQGATYAGLLLAAGALIAPSWSAAICLATVKDYCAPLVNAILSTIVVSVAGGMAWRTSGVDIHQRALQSSLVLGSLNLTLNADFNSSQLAAVDTHPHLVSLDAWTVGPTDLHRLGKRDEDTGSSVNNGTYLFFTSEYGTHTAHMPGDDVGTLVDFVLNAVPDEPNINTTINFTKRSQQFGVSWVSYIWDEANHDLDTEWYNEEGGSFDSQLEESLAQAIIDIPDWKYCIAPEVSKGEAISYDDIPGTHDGNGNALHGEVYFNTYGGLDNYCNSAHDGADRWR